MTQAGGTTTTDSATTADAATGTGSANTGTGQTEAQSGQQATTTSTEIWNDPAKAQAEILRLRRENGDERVNAKAKAADDARAEIAQTIGKALGIIKDGESLDPAKLQEQLQQRDADNRTLRVEVAVERAARAAGAYDDLMVAALARQGKLTGLDPTAATFQTDVDALVKGAVDADPRLKTTARAAGASGIEQTGGTGELGQITEEQLKTMTPEQIVDAHNKGLTKNLL